MILIIAHSPLHKLHYAIKLGVFLYVRKITLANAFVLANVIFMTYKSTVGIGCMLYAVMESDLRMLSPTNIVVKYPDDTNVLVPADYDIGLLQEFNHVKQSLTVSLWLNTVTAK